MDLDYLQDLPLNCNPMWKYSVVLSYLGTDFCGWQVQKDPITSAGLQVRVNKPSIQGVLQAALSRITSEPVTVVGSGRTDAGVHAVGQVAHFVLRVKEWETELLKKALNSLLPSSIQVFAVQRVPLNFHAQRSAVKKQYSYYFQQGPCALPHFEPLSWWIRKELDQKAMAKGLAYLRGEHDFKPFQASGSKPGSTVRTLFESEISFESFPFPHEVSSSGLVRVRLMGSGFLKQMVRGIAGTLLQVGEGRRPPECFQEILESRNRSLVGPTAPARALWLEKVWYPLPS